MPEEPPWVTLGRKDIGFHEVGDNQGQLGDPWCAIWANAKLEQSGIEGTRSASSQSFRHSPKFVALQAPALGALAVFWRVSPASGLGHVGFYMGETPTQILVLGGNESDAVRQQFETRNQLIGYWWPKSQATPQAAIITANAADGHPTGRVT